MASIINATTSTGLVSSADNSGSLQLATNNGTTAITIDSSQKVGIGTTSPDSNSVVTISGATPNSKLRLAGGTSQNGLTFASAGGGNQFYIYSQSGGLVTYDDTASAERMRITSSGDLLVGTTTTNGLITGIQASTSAYAGYFTSNYTASNNANIMLWGRSGGAVAAAVRYKDASTSLEFYSPTGHTIAYTTSSDYRLKENVTPMMGALATVAQLKPVTYTWKNGFGIGNGEGFIAHELQAVVPNCVTGEKDAVETYIDENGNEQTRPVYQGVDTSFLVATLTAAIQELKAELDATKAEVQALKGVA
jgi:hypothetical protein